MEQTDIGVRDGHIASLDPGAQATADETINATGLHVLPGLIDSHVHLRDPGDPAVETIPTGTKAAILGGLAAVFDMPNTAPSITDPARLAWKQDYAEHQSWCDIGLYVGGTKTNIDTLAALETGRGVCAIKIFAGSSTGDLLVEDDEHLERIMRAGRRRIAYHSEDEYRLQARRSLFKRGDPYARHMDWRDVETAFLGTRRLMALARKTGRPAHILHVSTAEELEYLKDFRDLATCEVLVNHLTQVGPEAYETLGGYAVMNPPIRDARHREAAWKAVSDGMVDTDRLRPRAPSAGEEGASVARHGGGTDRRSDHRADDAGAGERGPAVAAPPGRSDVFRPCPGLWRCWEGAAGGGL